ncbi:glycosyltransferase [Rhizobium dioscoreae]|uniref:glycosyltransferase n=1 Tax=Rhizobium dioscoreae TaxID=2653122 RepID=UPI0015646C00|nr:glycosyltransferase [Rhizobium dioscoreae]
MLRIAVEARQSTIVGHDVSLSVFLRIIRPLREFSTRKPILLIIETTQRLLEQAVPDFDVLIMNRPFSSLSAALASRAKALDIPVIVDVDDWMYGNPSYGKGLLKGADPQIISGIYALADCVVVPTSFFRQAISPSYRGPTYCIPYATDFCEEDAYLHRESTKSILLSSMFTLKLGSKTVAFAEAIKEFLSQNEDWQLDFYCENFDISIFSHDRISVKKPIGYKEYRKILSRRNYDFCIVPLSGYEDLDDILFNACKSPVKYVDYSAAGLPAIFSRSPVYEMAVTNKVTGLLVDNTTEDWLLALNSLASSTELRERLANNCYEDAKKHYTLERTAAAWEQVINSVVNRA